MHQILVIGTMLSFLSGCSLFPKKPEPAVQVPPMCYALQHFLQPTEKPRVQRRVNGDLLLELSAWEKALDSCNGDKAAAKSLANDLDAAAKSKNIK